MRLFITILLCLSFQLPAHAGPVSTAAAQGSNKITRDQIDAALAIIPKYAPDRLLVRFKPGTPAAEIARTHRAANATLFKVISDIDVQVLRVPSGQLVARLKSYRANPNVEFAHPDYNSLLYVPSEGIDASLGVTNLFEEQWGLNNTGQALVNPGTGAQTLTGTVDADIDASEAWDIHRGDASIKIAIIDSGIDCNAVDLVGKCIEQVNFVSDFTSTTADEVAHGTHVAGIAAANTDNDKGTAGVGWNSSIGNLKACFPYLIDLYPPYGVYIAVGVCPISASAEAITYAADNGYHVINMSYQSDAIDPVTNEPIGTAEPPDAETAAVAYAWSQGVVIVAAAGNAGNTDPVYPGAYSEVIAVAATDRDDNKPTTSSFGNTWISMMAPGDNIVSTEPDASCEFLITGYVAGVDDCVTWKSGTSMASPHVAGAAGLLWGQLYPGSDPATCTASNGQPCNSVVREILQGSADTRGALDQNFLSWSQNGRLNLYNMLNDGDADGIPTAADNCLDIANNAQANTDGDAQGNDCDLDDDNDGLSDIEETGTYGTDALLEDTDSDGVNDGLEVEAGTDPLLDTSTPVLYNGDANNDGKVNVADLLITMQIILDNRTATPLQKARLDIAPQVGGMPSPDGSINVADYVVLLLMIN